MSIASRQCWDSICYTLHALEIPLFLQFFIQTRCWPQAFFQLSYMSLIFACFVRQAMCIRPESARRGPPFIAEDILCPRDFPGPGKMINIILTVLMSGDRVLSWGGFLLSLFLFYINCNSVHFINISRGMKLSGTVEWMMEIQFAGMNGREGNPCSIWFPPTTKDGHEVQQTSGWYGGSGFLQLERLAIKFYPHTTNGTPERPRPK